LGATPEVLFSVAGVEDSTIVQTVALAGTRAAEPGAAHALLADSKERYEHQLVIDDLLETLAPLGRVEIGQTRVVELPTLIHLKTPINVRVPRSTSTPISTEGLARRLHPTPALGVSPRRLGFSEILRWDGGESRGGFGAPFAVDATLADGTRICECVVAIRNIQWHDGTIRLGSGCGIVPASDIEREWRELKLKRESVKKMLGL
jgi:menaquinone-specific isochorismate synthase